MPPPCGTAYFVVLHEHHRLMEALGDNGSSSHHHHRNFIRLAVLPTSQNRLSSDIEFPFTSPEYGLSNSGLSLFAIPGEMDCCSCCCLHCAWLMNKELWFPGLLQLFKQSLNENFLKSSPQIWTAWKPEDEESRFKPSKVSCFFVFNWPRPQSRRNPDLILAWPKQSLFLTNLIPSWQKHPWRKRLLLSSTQILQDQRQDFSSQ